MNSTEYEYKAVSGQDPSEEKSTQTMESGKKYRQILAAILANLSSAAVGTTLGWTSPVEPKLKDPELKDTPLGFIPDIEELAWIGSLVALGALIAPFVAGPLADIVGRKWTIIGSTFFFVLADIFLLTTCSVTHLYIARIIQGFGVGFVMTVTPMYIGEIASNDMRGALGSFMQLFIVSGILYVYVIGPYVSYYALQYACLAVPIIFAVTFYFMPDSAHFYIGKGKTLEATESLQFLRGMSAEGVKAELEAIKESVEESMKDKVSILDLFKSKGNLKALIICCGLISFQQLSGINVVLFYSQSIFEKTGSDLEPAVATIIVGLVQVLSSGCTPLIVERLGKKLILLISAAGMCVAMGLMGLYFYFDAFDKQTATGIGWLPVTSLIVYVIVYCIGFGPLPWAVLGEMFPPNIKSIASSMVASNCWILGFVVTRWFSTVDKALGTHWAFWIFTICCAIAFAFTFLTVFETKGMSLQQIQDRLNGRKSIDYRNDTATKEQF